MFKELIMIVIHLSWCGCSRSLSRKICPFLNSRFPFGELSWEGPQSPSPSCTRENSRWVKCGQSDFLYFLKVQTRARKLWEFILKPRTQVGIFHGLAMLLSGPAGMNLWLEPVPSPMLTAPLRVPEPGVRVTTRSWQQVLCTISKAGRALPWDSAHDFSSLMPAENSIPPVFFWISMMPMANLGGT